MSEALLRGFGFPPIVILLAAMVVFLAAASSLRIVAGGEAGLSILLLALCLYCLGNLMMVPVMRSSGMAVAMAASAVIQLLASSFIAFVVFAERPTMLQWTGVALGLVAIILILWPAEGA